MKKFAALLILLILPTCMAIDISVNAPPKVKKGDLFTVEVYANNVSSCGGLECNIYLSDNLVVDDVITYDVGADYNLTMTMNKNRSAAIQYAFLTNPKNEDFKVGEFKIKAIKSGNATITIKAVASDSEGNAIKIPQKTVNLKITSNSTQKTEKNDSFLFNPITIIFAVLLVGLVAYIIKKVVGNE
ncbi:hypothetical protein [Methanotorris igneus]|uniref:Cellulosome anchoring protein cohesin region n=1 Tax=Methanotorris igneus (strain DSM 5666 / JCM 11834 / Kol 5) TaxID=880724 RepID=F6BC20_METIK|nr:hypothetical protein [Methanotorris igneus]AEF96101.1 hypothetical protein Metig_0547 [Methanotorris igneus Kol 5]